MILDTLAEADRYQSLHPSLGAAFRFLQNLATSLEEGRWAIDGDACYAVVQRYTTRPLRDVRLETHDRYLDVHYLHHGSEQMLWLPRRALPAPEQPYDEKTDATLYPMPERATRLVVAQGEFVIFFPSDAHAPGFLVNQPAPVTKVVIKVRVGSS